MVPSECIYLNRFYCVLLVHKIKLLPIFHAKPTAVINVMLILSKNRCRQPYIVQEYVCTSNHVCIRIFTNSFCQTLIGTNYKPSLQRSFQQTYILMKIYTTHEICDPFFISCHDRATIVRAINCEQTSKVGSRFLFTDSPTTLNPSLSYSK